MDQVPTAGALRDPSDPAVVRLEVFQHADPARPRCAQLSVTAHVVRQDARSVTVATFGYVVPHGDANFYCAYTQAGGQSPYVDLPVALDRPLGQRRVVDARTGTVIGLLDDVDTGTPRYLPSGYGDGFHRAPDRASSFDGIRTYSKGDSSIEIHVGSATVQQPDGIVRGAATVHGHRAVVTDEGYQLCLYWSDRPGIVRSVCSLAPHVNYLPAAELRKIARSLA